MASRVDFIRDKTRREQFLAPIGKIYQANKRASHPGEVVKIVKFDYERKAYIGDCPNGTWGGRVIEIEDLPNQWTERSEELMSLINDHFNKVMAVPDDKPVGFWSRCRASIKRVIQRHRYGIG